MGMADDIRCPRCGTDEIHGQPVAANGPILLTCDRCGEEWTRQPQVSCPRCHTGDPYHRQYWGWEYDDKEEARQNPMASYDDVLRDEYSCPRCHHEWTVEAERRPGRGAAWRDSLARKPNRRSRASPATGTTGNRPEPNR